MRDKESFKYHPIVQNQEEVPYRSEVIISDEDIDFPKVEHPGILIVMLQKHLQN